MSGLGAMMAGGNGRGKPDKEWYPTPREATAAFLRAELGKILDLCDGYVREPACGDGALACVLEDHGLMVEASDLVARGYGVAGLDYLTWRPKGRMPGIITNPPFSLAEKFIRHSLALGAPYVGMYLKASYFHAIDRDLLWGEHRPAMIYALTFRPDSLGLGAPTMEAGWFVWRRRYRDDFVDAAAYRRLGKVDE
ncbi:hypothetical protein ACFPL7_22140 [Dongia soli]|uniref:Methyltransferase n=1 Tax=Dongia soli TaxID=600628 RepID=A0ABU5E8V2_9PROT|nr:hypothetical protein [Dongia soli]MDY0882291.1 hypothetical protein [Dongia soli]